MIWETGAGEDSAEPLRQAQVCDSGGTVVGGGKLRGAGTPLVADLNQAGGIIGKPEAKPIVEGGCRLVHQRLTGRLIGDCDLDILIVEFPQAGREAVVEAVVGGRRQEAGRGSWESSYGSVGCGDATLQHIPPWGIFSRGGGCGPHAGQGGVTEQPPHCREGAAGGGG